MMSHLSLLRTSKFQLSRLFLFVSPEIGSFGIENPTYPSLCNNANIRTREQKMGKKSGPKSAYAKVLGNSIQTRRKEKTYNGSET